jgi:3-oxoadipate enol-lactonase
MPLEPHDTLPERLSGFLQRPDCSLYYEVSGSGPAIVFLHGLGGNHMSWWQQVAHFAPSHTCVTFAARGFAPSTGLAVAPDPRDFAGDLAALIEHLQLRDVALAGQSMGGWGAMEYALHNPGNVRALVLAATTGTISLNTIGGAEQMRLAAWQSESRMASAALTQRRIHPAAGARMAEEQPSLHLLYRHIDDMNARLDKTILRERLVTYRTRAPVELTSLSCPVLFVSGDEDIVVPPFAADAIVRAVPGARVAHVADAGHSVYFERAARFNQLVGQFLAG